MVKRAVILTSGGLDSTVGLYWMMHKGYDCYPLFVDYGQKNRGEEESIRTIVDVSECSNRLAMITIDAGHVIDSGLTTLPIKEIDRDIEDIEACSKKVSTYFPARNLILLSLALGYAESKRADTIFIGCFNVTSIPDCGKKFMALFEDIAQKSTEAGRRGTEYHIKMFKKLSKPEIILLGEKLGVPFEFTTTCFNPKAETSEPCMSCDACTSRSASFEEVGIEDPLVSKWAKEAANGFIR